MTFVKVNWNYFVSVSHYFHTIYLFCHNNRQIFNLNSVFSKKKYRYTYIYYNSVARTEEKKRTKITNQFKNIIIEYSFNHGLYLSSSLNFLLDWLRELRRITYVPVEGRASSAKGRNVEKPKSLGDGKLRRRSLAYPGPRKTVFRF